MSIFNQKNQSVGTQVNALPTPKFSTGQTVVYRVADGREVIDIRCQVLDVIYSQNNGYSYKLSKLKDYFASDIKAEKDIRLAIIK